ncbi:hypothetical protein CsSME_00050668 [Camellia sinensis var. sinensis]
MENEDVTHEERVEFEQQMNGYLRLIEFEKIHGVRLGRSIIWVGNLFKSQKSRSSQNFMSNTLLG